MFEHRTVRNGLNFGAAFIISYTVCSQSVGGGGGGKALSRILTVFPMFDPRIYIERIELTTQFFFQ